MPRNLMVDQMPVTIFESNAELGRAAAEDLAQILQAELRTQEEVSILLATGNSQLTFLHSLQARQDVAWSRVRIFQLDEYMGIPETHPASFRRFHHEHLIDAISPLAFYGIQGDALNPDAEIDRYTRLLALFPPCACVLGIGENGHLAFNDPPADFETTATIHRVTLDEKSRQQQVGEGHYAKIEDVPHEALSLTVSAVLKPPHVLAVVPEKRKARAVLAALEGPVMPECPASILRTRGNVVMYLDEESGTFIV